MAKKKKDKPESKKTKTNNNFDVSNLNSLFKKVYLGGAIEECLLKIKSGVGIIEAIDPTNCVFVSAQERICDKNENCELGIMEMGTIIKLLDSIKEDEVEFKVISDQIVFKIKGRGEAKFTLGKSELISTAVSDGMGIKEIKKGTPHKIDIAEKSVKDFGYFMGLFGSTTTTINIKKDKINIGSGEDEEKSFNTLFGKGKKIPDLNISVYGELFKSILNELEWGEDATVPTLNVGEDNPVVIEQGEAIWALTPEEGE